jgi:lipoprotein-releasing system ATP-binding protein
MSAANPNNVISVLNLCKKFETGAETREILKHAALVVNAGQSVAIMGPSGSGKSTLLNIIGTLDAPSSGTVEILGKNPFALNEAELALFRNSCIGFVFQSHHLLPQCSVLENVLLPTIVASSPLTPVPAGEGKMARAKRLLERVGLTSRMDDRPGRLSGGERQRAAVVRALINAPRILLADEPTGSLDSASAENIGNLLAELKREENLAMIVVTHTLTLAQKMDEVMQLQDGKLSNEPLHTP